MDKRYRLLLSALYLASSILYADCTVCALDVPKLKGYVNDYAGMLSPSAEAHLEQELQTFENTDAVQIVILTIPSLEGDVIEQFSIRVAESWKIGHRDKDSGIIFLVAKQERKMRIEVGRGLEGRLTDLMAGRIVDYTVKPRFKQDDFDGGFRAGVQVLKDAVRGEFKAEPKDRGRKTEVDTISRFFTVALVGMILLLLIGNISRAGAAVTGAIGAPAAAKVMVSSISLPVLAVLSVLGLIAGLLVPVLFSSGRYHRRYSRSGEGGTWPGGYHGGGWSSPGGSGDFGGGGFSGSGGDFGGGGASGDW